MIKEKETINSIYHQFKSDVLKRLMPNLLRIGLTHFPDDLLLLAFKEERQLELYTNLNGKWTALKKYNFTNFSGQLGPKLKEGDKQIPEGLYKLDYLNPNSKFHLSVKINYPNNYDLEKAKIDNRDILGSDIFIHGKNKTTGCIPIGDGGIEELFLMVAYVKKIGNEVKLIISPRDFRKKNSFPTINTINWSNELYIKIKNALTNI